MRFGFLVLTCSAALLFALQASGGGTGPPQTIVAVHNKASLPDGTRVELVSVGRERMGRKDPDRIWTPSGHLLKESAVRSPDYDFFDPDSRWLTFKITKSTSDTMVGLAYLPSQTKGEEAPYRFYSRRGEPSVTTASVHAHKHGIDKAVFGISTRTWKEVGSINGPITRAGRLLEGPWGKLRMLFPSEQYQQTNAKLRMARETFQVDAPSKPPRYGFRIQIFDRKGQEITSSRDGLTRGDQEDIPAASLKDVARITVERAPLVLIEFRDVHLDPSKATRH